MPLDLNLIRAQFPALQRPTLFFDNPGGTQVARSCLERMTRYLVDTNANHGGLFHTSRESDALVEKARQAVADFLNAREPAEIVFGANMTSLTFQISRSIGRLLQPGDHLVVTRLDHDANITPWVRVAEECNCHIRWVDFKPGDCTLDLADYEAALAEHPKVVAFGYASNAVGTIHPVEKMTEMAKAAGALVYVDAVQYAPHGPIDVQQIGCDFLVCSAYKFFGPHLGVLYGRREVLENLPAYRVRPAPAEAPGKFETGTGNFEGMAGLLGALEYFEWLGYLFGEDYLELYAEQYPGRRLVFKQAMSAVRSYEYDLSRELLQTLLAIPGVKIYGIQDPDRLPERVPTVSFTLEGYRPAEIAQYLAERNINVWNGNFYALAVTERLGLEGDGGLVRIGATHYNTKKEIERLAVTLAPLGMSRSTGGI
ncbi:cysteine desulfurase family protein, VC1184 subfamily [Longilinea arvoryzae]|uniref:Cysteine desulfurase family protein, VC1184 subfamily n=1 Tax=Longilinea arvoryzae TaxID=360412 RepID=A0A0S7BMH6_9CHLR|nr:cysteine desulfurase-like protein [Longilinea arvoryzae]GAP15464.1 cysteine desulfurase family protein, VC1184 subfamily [Longilinea arvoryzae]